jgi:hypothetical protein
LRTTSASMAASCKAAGCVRKEGMMALRRAGDQIWPQHAFFSKGFLYLRHPKTLSN